MFSHFLCDMCGFRPVSILFIFAFLAAAGLAAQTTDVGPPASQLLKIPAEHPEPVYFPEIDVQSLMAEDALNRANNTGPWRFGFPHEADINLIAEGKRDRTHDGAHIYRMTFSAPGALSMNVFFHAFKLPEGGYFHVYNADLSAVDGAYTAANNQPDKMLATVPIPGDEITVEYYAPPGSEDLTELVIGTVVQGYRPIRAFFENIVSEERGLNDSGPCNYDTGCTQQPGNPFGDPGAWDEQIASVAVMMNNGFAFCSGALVNNTANDGTPYFLSANHCGTSGGGGLTVLFGWESPSPSCATVAGSVNGPADAMVNGAVLRANRSGSDFALWELSTVPPASYNVYYAGWDRTGNQPSEVTGIHHPSGDVKKICREEDAPYQSVAAGAQVWWIDDWEYGVTEPGSSGSPIFDQSKRIVGQLYGGLAACSGTSNNGSYDYYGRFDVSWDAGGSPASRLSDWLDPLGTGQTVLDGYSPNAPSADLDAGITAVNSPEGSLCGVGSAVPEITLRNFGVQTLTSAVITYGTEDGPEETYLWLGNLTSGQTVSVVLPAYEFGGTGVLTFSATVSDPNGLTDENPANDTANAELNLQEEGQSVELEIILDCWGSEVTWEIADNNSGAVVASGGPYQNGTPGAAVGGSLCLSPGCYTFTIFDSFGDGLAGSMYSSCGVDGDYNLTDAEGNILAEQEAANFGSEASHSFCIEEAPPVQTPCTSPYPIVTGLNAEVLPNGVQLSWDPIIGSKGCQIQGGPANASSTLVTTEVIQDDLSGFFVPASQLPFLNEIYRWRVRCGCRRNPSIVGAYTPYAFFFWQGSGSNMGSGSAAVENLEVFPNPTPGPLSVRIFMGAEAEVSLAVFDIAGRRLSRERVHVAAGEARLELNLGHLPPAVYVLRAETGSSLLTRTFVITR